MYVKKERPLSPHITIYKPQLSSILSISHRMSGVFNFLGMLFFLWWVVFLAFATVPYSETMVYMFFQSIFGRLVLLAWTFSLFLHMCTGIRHLFWDMGYGFGVQTMTRTGLFAVAMAVILTAFTWSICFVDYEFLWIALTWLI